MAALGRKGQKLLRPVALIGFMGAGKSLVGRGLAEALGASLFFIVQAGCERLGVRLFGVHVEEPQACILALSQGLSSPPD